MKILKLLQILPVPWPFVISRFHFIGKISILFTTFSEEACCLGAQSLFQFYIRLRNIFVANNSLWGGCSKDNQRFFFEQSVFNSRLFRRGEMCDKEGFRGLIMCLFYEEYIFPWICWAFEYKPCLKAQCLSVRYPGRDFIGDESMKIFGGLVW